MDHRHVSRLVMCCAVDQRRTIQHDIAAVTVCTAQPLKQFNVQTPRRGAIAIRHSQLPASADPPPNGIQIQSAVFHNTLDRQTDGLTDGLGDKTCTNTRLSSIDCSDAANYESLSLRFDRRLYSKSRVCILGRTVFCRRRNFK